VTRTLENSSQFVNFGNLAPKLKYTQLWVPLGEFRSLVVILGNECRNSGQQFSF
jgi:hypothetical protein